MGRACSHGEGLISPTRPKGRTWDTTIPCTQTPHIDATSGCFPFRTFWQFLVYCWLYFDTPTFCFRNLSPFAWLTSMSGKLRPILDSDPTHHAGLTILCCLLPTLARTCLGFSHASPAALRTHSLCCCLFYFQFAWKREWPLFMRSHMVKRAIGAVQRRRSCHDELDYAKICLIPQPCLWLGYVFYPYYYCMWISPKSRCLLGANKTGRERRQKV